MANKDGRLLNSIVGLVVFILMIIYKRKSLNSRGFLVKDKRMKRKKKK